MFLKSPKNKKELKNQQTKLQKPTLGVIYYRTDIDWWLLKIVQRFDVM